MHPKIRSRLFTMDGSAGLALRNPRPEVPFRHAVLKSGGWDLGPERYAVVAAPDPFAAENEADAVAQLEHLLRRFPAFYVVCAASGGAVSAVAFRLPSLPGYAPEPYRGRRV